MARSRSSPRSSPTATRPAANMLADEAGPRRAVELTVVVTAALAAASSSGSPSALGCAGAGVSLVWIDAAASRAVRPRSARAPPPPARGRAPSPSSASGDDLAAVLSARGAEGRWLGAAVFVARRGASSPSPGCGSRTLSVSWDDWLPMILLASLLARGSGARALVVAAVLALSTLLAALAIATGVPLSERPPRDADADFFGPVLDRLQQGVLDFYEITAAVRPHRLPGHARGRPARRSSGSRLVIGMLVMARTAGGRRARARRGVAWPATLDPGAARSGSGVLALLGVSPSVPAGGRSPRAASRRRSSRRGRPRRARGRRARTSGAVAKPAVLSWQTWDPYDRPTEPVSVDLRVAGELRRDQVPREADAPS